MNNNHKVQDSHTTCLGPEEDKQEGRLRGLIYASAGKITDCSYESPEFKFQHPHGGSETTHNEILHPLLVCLKTATVYLHTINK